MRRAKSIVAVVAVALALAALAQAAGIKKPPLGPWAAEGRVVFTLKKGLGKHKGKVLLTDYRLRTEVVVGCPDQPVVARVLGRYPLKQFSRAGFTAWGVGRNVSGEPGPQPAKVTVDGQVYGGSFYVLWNYENASQVSRAVIEFDDCRTELVFAKPK
ncbi:MAG TPA: hypothetical protein VGV69_08915 [Solirubrobacterales bacterium]|nr:hypothetical protein [Solirubrobacterales bacterium]